MSEQTEQQQITNLTEKLTRIDQTNFEVIPEENVPCLYINGKLICGVSYALALSDERLKDFIDETVQVGGD